MLKIGITGGIGAGKTTVTKAFIAKGIPVFYADDEAKKLMHANQKVKHAIQDILGKAAYSKEGEINKQFIAQKIFSDPQLKEQINQVIHPAVRVAFDEWAEKQTSQFVLNEAAIIFETGSYHQFDYTILVTAPEDIRIQRVMKRDQLTVEEVKSRINNQWPDDQKEKIASFIIRNDKDIASIERQVDEIFQKLNLQIK